MSNFAERILQKYPDGVFISSIIGNIKSHLYKRSFRKAVREGEGVSFVSGYNVPKNIVSYLFELPFSDVALWPSMAPAYMLGRVTDDMADGDVDPKVFGYDDFPSFIKTAKRQIRDGSTGVKKGYTLDFLLKFTIEKLEKQQKPGDDIRECWDQFFDAMLVEYDRRINQKVLTKDELRILYEDSFRQPDNILLISLNSNTRFKDIEEMSPLQGKVYALRDLKSDLATSICNIPKEVLEKAHLDLPTLVQNPDLVDDNGEIAAWVKEELDLASELYDKMKKKIPKFDLTAKIYLYSLLRLIEGRMKRIKKKWS